MGYTYLPRGVYPPATVSAGQPPAAGCVFSHVTLWGVVTPHVARLLDSSTGASSDWHHLHRVLGTLHVVRSTTHCRGGATGVLLFTGLMVVVEG